MKNVAVDTLVQNVQKTILETIFLKKKFLAAEINVLCKQFGLKKKVKNIVSNVNQKVQVRTVITAHIL